MNAYGLTVYGCERDEADLFEDLCPGFGVVPTLTSASPSEGGVVVPSRNRCISVGHKSEISAQTLRVLRDAGVEHISTRSIGFDHIDMCAADDLGIVVKNVVYAPDGVADYTLMLILMALRNATSMIDAVKNHDFRLGCSRGKDLRDMTVGVVGVGHIGGAVIRRLQGFGCRVLATNNRRVAQTGAEFTSLDALLVESDVVTLHLPLDARTHHIIGREQIAMMKPGAFLINTGRGALVDTGALVAALENLELGGAAVDVLEGEEGHFYIDCSDRPVHNEWLLRLLQLPNVIVTPHTAYFTERALYDTVEGTLVQCLRFERSRANDQIEDRDLVRGLL
jgi:D-specific alpha-keto acid dehydrogenase